MEFILQARALIVRFVKQYETVILFVLKFAAGFVILSIIAGIGHPSPELTKYLKPSLMFPYTTLLSLVIAVSPATLCYLLIALNITFQLSASLELSALVFCAMALELVFYIRLAPRKSWLILAMFFGFYFRIPYVVPLLAGLYAGLAAIIPLALGVLAWYALPVVSGMLPAATSASSVSAAASAGAVFDVTQLPANIQATLNGLLTGFLSSQQWIFTAFVFAMAVVVVYVISRLNIDYAKEMAIGLGVVLIFVSFVVMTIISKNDVSLPGVFFISILCGLIAAAVRFFDMVLDYSRAERVEFEDEENFYYVRVIPKVILPKKHRTVRQIRPSPREFEEYEAEEERDEDDVIVYRKPRE